MLVHTYRIQVEFGRGDKMNPDTTQDIEFDLVGVDASIANALRRIMLAEVSEFLLLMAGNEY
jgi:DNA-directed RNA polymerase alpha subunit